MPPRIDARGRAKRIQGIAKRLAAAVGGQPTEQKEMAQQIEKKCFGEAKNAHESEAGVESKRRES